MKLLILTMFAESLTGILLILMGLLVAKFPGMINLFPKEERKKKDMKAISRMTRKWSVGIGISQILAVCVFRLFDVGEIKILFYLLLVMVGVIIMAAKSLSSKYKL